VIAKSIIVSSLDVGVFNRVYLWKCSWAMENHQGAKWGFKRSC
jgi:hypothetical protein